MAIIFTASLVGFTRLRLISLLASAECCVCDLVQQLGMTDSAISHQLRTLRTDRLVRCRNEGRQVFYRLHDHHAVALYRTVQGHLAESFHRRPGCAAAGPSRPRE